MIIDAHSIVTEETIDTDICIIGAGPAGITLAKQLVNRPWRICLVDSGSFEYEQETQDLCEAEIIGNFFPEPHKSRQRQFGGTANLWSAPSSHLRTGFRCLPLDTIDFEQRDWVPYSGWPFSKVHLDPFYKQAQTLCKIGDYTYNVADWESNKSPRLPFIGDRLTTSICQYGLKTTFLNTYREEIKKADNIKILIHANALELETDETIQKVTRIRLSSLRKNIFCLIPKIVILATGGIENARLLLLSNRQQKTGLGNQNDLVGRFFMDHPILSYGTLIPNHRNLFNKTDLYDIKKVRGTCVLGKIRPTETVLRQEKLLNNGALFFPRPLAFQAQAVRSRRELSKSICRGKLPEDTLKHLRQIAVGSNYIAAAAFWAGLRKLPGLRRGGWSFLPYEKQRFSVFEVVAQAEQVPDPDNRVMLSSECDHLGQPKAQLCWRLTDKDKNSIKQIQKLFAEEFERAGIGRLECNVDVDELPPIKSTSAYHHLGTTRMHTDPKQGVVDANCKVHGISNLFVTGSSVFPTGGFANPTLTIVALAIRLAERMETLMQ